MNKPLLKNKVIFLQKILNASLLTASYIITVFTKRIVAWGMPMSVSVEPSNKCNLSCKECPVNKNSIAADKANMTFDLYKKIVDELSPYLINITMYFQGEPFINSLIYRFIAYASVKKIYSNISTNGHYLTKKNIDKIFSSKLKLLIVSVDGTTQDVYEKYRVGGSLKTVLKGLKLLVEEKQTRKEKYPKIIWQFLVTGENEHQIEEARNLAKRIGVDKIIFKTAQIYNFENGSPLIPKNERFSRYKKMPNGKYQIKSKLHNRCWRLWTNPVITSSGDVLPCCFDKEAKYKMGNINSLSFRDIWKSEKYNEFRKQVFSNRKNIDICQNCTEGLKA